ncbi:MAG: GNAT family N-acetyltransferase [Clostridia bacterium]|nr:GNAT family N-acetyltransferase [Oscillospiraceae bacterium]MBQ4103166.1 GNAT family N-acetyltransferase [Clostridia bacterium]
MIVQVDNYEQLNICCEIIQKSFLTVAEEFGITKNNCPSYTGFITIDKLRKQFDEDKLMFLYYDGNIPVGYFSLSECSDGEWELNNLAVLPELRHLGIGKSLVDFATEKIKENNGNKIYLGIVEENVRLKKWYEKLGFVHIGVKKFENLPFTVGFMKKRIK